jgi:hypothetical protein
MTRSTIFSGVLSSFVLLAGSLPALAQAATPEKPAQVAQTATSTSPNASANPSTAASAASSSTSAAPADQSDIRPRPSTSRAPAVFLTGSYGVGRDESSHFVTNVPGGIQTDLSGRSIARSFGVGTFLTPHISVRVEMTLPTTLTVGSTTAGSPVVTSLEVAQTTRTGAVLFGYHTSSAKPVSVEYLGGVLFVSQRQDSTSQVQTATGTPLAPPMVSDAFAYKSAAIAGADVNVALGRYLSLVPEFRAWSLGGTFSTRVSLGFRVNF